MKGKKRKKGNRLNSCTLPHTLLYTCRWLLIFFDLVTLVGPPVVVERQRMPHRIEGSSLF